MKYKSEFIELVSNYPDSYIGTGNPNGQILIIGKECAIDPKEQEYKYKSEILHNPKDWLLNIENNTGLEDVDDWFTAQNPKYNPLYPYKGQLTKKYVKDKNGIENGGTSSTWLNYQKLYDLIFSNELKSMNINFHENCFLSEFSQITAKYSLLVKKELKRESIQKRTQLFQAPFFRQFPIIIVACGMDVRDYSIDLEAIFNVKFKPDTRITILR